ncbi:testis-expressed sequence 10-like protein [Plakobranchus ocellatus]|uniref:Testis-expressed sequence 10-like protein n=1 Tax=Plakobranchus ocellatus TaxID=259542 RepID=A0AAV4AU89_9GAST|nr:testis-expressed sequence 10-like protein [Plakobranchus ocellatus]
MPKSKKKKKQDFQKVKLKVGKRLPKGDNVTNLSFKTRQIQLTQRIKDDAGQGLVTKKKENVQDLLRQCDHHSSSSRLSAVMGLRELWLSSYTEMMVPTNTYGYSTILKKLSHLLIDNEATVRHAVVNLFKVILNKITKNSTARPERVLGGSLFVHIHAFLCCAMNHVHEDVRLDALLLYDALLETCPALVVQQTGGLLRNLVGLLVTSTPSHVGAKGDSVTQKLSLNPESRLPVMVFRVRVLSRIKRTLQAALDETLVSHSELETASNFNGAWSLHNDCSERTKEQHTCIVSRQAVNRFQIMLNGGSHDLDDYITNPSSLESFIHQCLPVLVQCWKEARADNDTHNESASLLTSAAVELVSLVVSVIQLLFVLSAHGKGGNEEDNRKNKTLVAPRVITKHFFGSFEKLLMGGFPYSAQVEVAASKRKSKKKKTQKELSDNKDVSTQASLSALNLGICDIMSTFCMDQSLQFSKILLKKIGRHCVSSLSKMPNVDQCNIIIRIIENVFLNPQTADHFTKVYKAALKCYSAAVPKSRQKKLFFNLFYKIGRIWDGWSRARNESDLLLSSVFRYKENGEIEETLVSFFLSLSQLALTVHSLGDDEWTLNVLRMLRHSHFLRLCKPFENNLSQVLDPAKGLFATCNEQIQRHLCAVISTGLPFSKENLRQLLYLIRCPPDKPVIHNRKSLSCVSHVLFSMFANIRACVSLTNQLQLNQMSSEEHQLLSDYLRFLFSLQLGFTGEDLDQMCPVVSRDKENTSWLAIDFSVCSAQWERHLEISQIVATEIASFSLSADKDLGFKYGFTFMNNFEHFWTQTFSNREKMHILSVIGLVKLVLRASQPGVTEKPGQELVRLTSIAAASVLASMYEPDMVSAVSSNLAWQIKAELTSCLASTVDASIIKQVMELLGKRAQGDFGGSSDERSAAKSAQDFVLTDETLQLKLDV